MRIQTFIPVGDPVAMEIDVEVEGTFYPTQAATREHPEIPEYWAIDDAWILRDGRRISKLPDPLLECTYDDLTDALDRAAKRRYPDFRGLAY